MIYLASGFAVIPPGTVGYGLLFGNVYKKNIPSGLHYFGPSPFVRVDKWPIKEIKTITTPSSYEFVSGDLNLLSLSVSMQYRIKEPYTYHYVIENLQQVIESVIRNDLRSFVSARDLERLLNVHRETLERRHIDKRFDATPDPRCVRSIEQCRVGQGEPFGCQSYRRIDECISGGIWRTRR